MSCERFVRVANKGLRRRVLTVNGLNAEGIGEWHGSEGPALRKLGREPNAETLSAQREEKSGEGEGDKVVGERNRSDLLRASIGDGSRVSYQLSIDLSFTE